MSGAAVQQVEQAWAGDEALMQTRRDKFGDD